MENVASKVSEHLGIEIRDPGKTKQLKKPHTTASSEVEDIHQPAAKSISERSPFKWNILLQSLGFFFIFMTYNTAESLESTLIRDTTMGNISLGVLYGVFAILGFVAPFILSFFGPRIGMVIAAVPYGLMTLVNALIVEDVYDAHPSASSLSYGLSISSFALVGAAAPFLWTSQGIYMMRNAVRHAHVVGSTSDNATAYFNGLFYALFQFTGALGNVLSGVVMMSVSDPALAGKYVYIGLTVSCGLGVICLMCLRRVEREGEYQKVRLSTSGETANLEHVTPQAPPQPSKHSLLTTLKQLRDPRIFLLVPLIFYNGASIGFMLSNMPVLLISPFTSENMVGFIIAFFYLVNTGFTYITGTLTPRMGRLCIFFIALAAHALYWVLVPVLASLEAHISNSSAIGFVLLFLMAGLFGIGDAVWESFIPALWQNESFLEDESDRDAAMSNLKLWQALGFAFQFGLTAWASFQEDPNEVYIISAYSAGMLALAAVCVVALHRRVRSLNAGLDPHTCCGGDSRGRPAGEHTPLVDF